MGSLPDLSVPLTNSVARRMHPSRGRNPSPEPDIPMATPTRDELILELKALRAGIVKNLATFSFIVGGKTYPASDALALIDATIASASSVLEARANLADVLGADRALGEQNAPILKGFRDMIGLMYAESGTMLSDFGLAPRKPRTPLTVEKILARSAKSRATRAKRKTMGKRQKAAIKGDVAGVVIAPVTADGGGEKA